MKNYLLFLICLLVAVQLASVASAGVIGSYTMSQTFNASGEGDWIISLAVGQRFVSPRTFLFNGPDTSTFSANGGIDIFSNIGRTFWDSSDLDDPEYSSFVSQLSDGRPDDVRLWASDIGYWIPLNELAGQQQNPDFVDFKGYTIERIGLTIDSASHSVDYGATYPHIYNWTITTTIEGAEPVPEPASFVPLLVGICGLCGFRYRHSIS
ncbi:MAG: hypothetical protein Q7N50_15595 [Armatimonadota bacterium]|nr:hypothetical protein [Armatimonadota bacterium]